MRRSGIALAAGAVLLSLVLWRASKNAGGGGLNAGPPMAESSDALPLDRATTSRSVEQPASPTPGKSNTDHVLHDAVVVSPCHLAPIQEQELSSAVEGVLKDILVDLGGRVRPGDVLGRLDERQLRAQVELLNIKAASKAAEFIAKAQHDDLEAKIGMAGKLRQRDAISELEYKSYYYQRQRFAHEIERAREEQAAAHKELEKGKILLDFHEIRSGLDGEIIKVYKRKGEAVKASEPLFRLANFDRLRIEGLCKLQQADLIRVGMPALVEPEERGEQLTQLTGHTGSITALAVSADGSLVASAGEDHTVLLWNWPAATRAGVLSHPAEVHALALRDATDAAGHGGHLLLSGCADGQARLWFVPRGHGPTPVPCDLGIPAHEAPVRAVAFTSDGKRFVTGGDDRRIGIWDRAGGRHLFWLQASPEGQAHNGPVTSLQVTPDGHLVSAGRDNTLRVWKLDAEGGRLLATQPGRTGEVTRLGLSPDGGHLLFDHGEELRILDRESLATVGLLRSPRQERFRNLAQFSPGGKLILAGGGNGRAQLWRIPASPETSAFLRRAYARGFHASTLAAMMSGLAPFAQNLDPAPPHLWSLDAFEVRSFVSPGPSVVQCAAFAPDESVLFTGGTDKVIRVWPIPAPRQYERRLEARITYVGSQVESGTDMVRIRALVVNPQDPQRRLRPGTQATLRLYPETAGLP